MWRRCPLYFGAVPGMMSDMAQDMNEYMAFFFNRWLHRISRILAVLDYEGVKQATPEVLRPERKSSAHFTMT